MQRFDSGLRLNVHFHVLWLDGAYGHEVGRGAMQWREHEDLADADVLRLVRRVRDRVVKALRRQGKWWDDADATSGDAESGDEQQQLLLLAAGAVVGRSVLGEHAGAADVRVDRGTRHEPFVKGPLCADCDGFSLHAGVRVAAGDRRRLEHLARYAGRPAIAASRLVLLEDGRVAYSLKKRWKDGTTAVVMAPEVLIERLLALVPRRRRHLVTYPGVLGPAAGLRSRVVPGWVEGEGADEAERSAPPGADDEAGERTSTAILAQRRGRRRTVPHAPQVRGRRYPRAELLRRVFEVEALVCPHCGGRRRLLAAVTAPEAIERVLRSMGLASEAPELAPARAPPGGDAAEWGA